MGSVYRRGRIYWIKYSWNGRVHRESSHSALRRDAVSLLLGRLEAYRSGRGVPPANLSVDDMLRLVSVEYEQKPASSRRRALQAFQHLQLRLGRARVRELGSESLAAYLDDRVRSGAALATVAVELALLKRGFTLAARRGLVTQRPAFPSVRVSNARQGFFEEEEFSAVLRELPEELRAPLHVAYLTGWRVSSEILSLTWRQVDLSAGVIRLEPGTTKNGEGREWPLDPLPELRALLERQEQYTQRCEARLGRPIRVVFHRDGRPIRDFRTAWSGACRRAGIEGRRPHDLRRTAVRNLERSGVSRSVAMKLVGHRTESMYRRYAIVSHRDLAEGVAKLAKLRQEAITSA